MKTLLFYLPGAIILGLWLFAMLTADGSLWLIRRLCEVFAEKLYNGLERLFSHLCKNALQDEL